MTEYFPAAGLIDFRQSDEYANSLTRRKRTPWNLIQHQETIPFLNPVWDLSTEKEVSMDHAFAVCYLELISTRSAGEIESSTKMCFGKSKPRGGENSQSARPIELRPPVPEGIRRAKTMQELGYEVFPAGTRENPDIQRGTDRDLDFYTVYHVNAGPEDAHIALLGACEETGLLVVLEIYTVRDPRDYHRRPRAAAIFLSFWLYYLGQPIESLRTIFFQTVTEDTMGLMRPQIYRDMDHELWQNLDVRRGSDYQGERSAFNLTCKETKFGQCVKLMETKNQVMKDSGIKVAQFRFRPQDESGLYYSFAVDFGISSNHQHHHHHHHHHHGGHGRRR